MFSPFSNCPHERDEYFTQQFEQELKNTNKPKKELTMSDPENWTPSTEAGWKALAEFKELQHGQKKEIEESETKKRLEEVHKKPMTHDEYLVKDLTKQVEEVTQHYAAEYIVDALAIIMNKALDDLSKKKSKTKMSFIRNLIRGQK